MIIVTKMGEAEHDGAFRVLREHGHPVYLLLLIKTPAYFETQGREALTPPDVAVLFRPGQRHCYRAAEERYADCWMLFSASALPLFEGFPFGVPVPMRGKERFYGLFRTVCDEFYGNRRNRTPVIDHLVSALLEMLSSEIELRDALFYPMLALREEIFRLPANRWTVPAAAGQLGVSCGYFHLLYKKYFDTTFLADVVRARIQNAQELLLATRESVERIAERCGYLNTEHFIRQFRQQTGTTPARYRRSLQE